MKKWKNWLVFGAVVLLLGGVAAWRLWPRPLESVMSLEKPVDRVSGFLQDWTWEAGLADSPQYTRESGYQEDFRNLLPWDSGLSSHSAQWLSVTAFVDGEEPDCCSITLLGQEACRINDRRAHPTDGQLFQRLADYLRAHGTLMPKTGAELAHFVTEGMCNLGEIGSMFAG